MGAVIQMTSPTQAFYRFVIALGLGCLLGVYYGFLRPLRPRLTAISDLLFLPVAGWVWLYLSFAVCRGDLRFGYTLGLIGGVFLWEATIGRLLRPVFAGFWQAVGKFLAFFLRPIKFFTKKGAKYLNFLLATAKKRFTIKRKPKEATPRQASRVTKDGGASHGRRKKSLQPDPAGIQTQFQNR